MSFFDSIIESLGVEANGYFRVMMIADGTCYVENVLSIKSYSQTEIIVRLKKGGLSISGENMYIKKYCCGDLAVCGKIKSLTLI